MQNNKRILTKGVEWGHNWLVTRTQEALVKGSELDWSELEDQQGWLMEERPVRTVDMFLIIGTAILLGFGIAMLVALYV